MVDGTNVIVQGGYHHVKRGYLVTITKIKKQQMITTLFTDLVFSSSEEQEAVFEKLYHLSPQKAFSKGQRKGVPPQQAAYQTQAV